VHGRVGPAVENGPLDLDSEDAATAQLGQRSGGVVVTGRVDLDERRGDAPFAQTAGHVVSLGEGERAAARRQAEFAHRSKRFRRDSTRRWPRSVPAASLSAMVGAWAILATIERVSDSTRARCSSLSESMSARRRVELGLAQRVEVVAELPHDRGCTTAATIVVKPFHFDRHDGLGFGHRVPSLFQGLFDDLAQGFDIETSNSGHIRDVPGNGSRHT
jgi:hypothetical protein